MSASDLLATYVAFWSEFFVFLVRVFFVIADILYYCDDYGLRSG